MSVRVRFSSRALPTKITENIRKQSQYFQSFNYFEKVDFCLFFPLFCYFLHFFCTLKEIIFIFVKKKKTKENQIFIKLRVGVL